MKTIEKHKLQPSKSFTEQHSVLDGSAIVYRTPQSGDMYQFRTWLPDERKYYRRSLKTRDLETAKAKAISEYVAVRQRVDNGLPMFTITFGKLVDLYLEHQDERVESMFITYGRRKTIESQLKHLLRYLGRDQHTKTLGRYNFGSSLKISEVDRNSFAKYAFYRRATNPEVRDVTLRNEQTTINALLKWAFRKGYVHFEDIDFEEIKITQVEKRDAFSRDEYGRLWRFMHHKWLKEENLEPKQLEQRNFIRDFILIKANSFLRFGELKQLKWKDIKIYKNENRGPHNWGYYFVDIKVRAEISKVRKDRELAARGGDFFKRVKSYSMHTKPDDFIFVDNDTGEMITKNAYYRAWKDIMSKVDIDTDGRKLSFYSLRHFGITMRLSAGVSYETMKVFAGTSFKFLEDHYDQRTIEQLRDEALTPIKGDEWGVAYVDL